MASEVKSNVQRPKSNVKDLRPSPKTNVFISSQPSIKDLPDGVDERRGAQ